MCICTTTSLSIHLSVEIGCFHVLAIVNSASVNIGVHVSFSVIIFSGCMFHSEIVGSYGSFILFFFLKKSSYCSPPVQSSPVTQSCTTLCDPMDCSMPGFPVLPQLPKLAQIHVHQVSDAIQPSHPLSSPSPPAFNLSQHQGLF